MNRLALFKLWFRLNFNYRFNIRFKPISFRKEKPIKTIDDKIKLFKNAGVNQFYIDELMLSQYVEGRNLDENNNEIWVCNCGNRIKKFTSRNDYVSHHLRGHS